MKIMFSVVFQLAFVGTSWSQTLTPIPKSWENSSGYLVSGYSAKVVGTECHGGQNYKHKTDPSDFGVSKRTWANVSKAHGGTLCSGGSWFYGGGRAGQRGGSERDVLIKGGKLFWVQ